MDVVDRALDSGGVSNAAVYRMVQSVLARRRLDRGTLLDVGCGRGDLRRFLGPTRFDYVGADVLRHDGYPGDAPFHRLDLDSGRLDLEAEFADVVVCVETIEHVENPRAVMRELVRLTKPGGWLVVTTPNQLSLASKLCLLTKNEFLYFQEGPGLYPAHISALLEVDLFRMARECRLEEIAVEFSGHGRIPLSARHWPAPLGGHSGSLGRLFSDNLALSARKPGARLAPEKTRPVRP